jgi:hypothetical protein
MTVKGTFGKEDIELYNAAEEDTLRRLLYVTELNSKADKKTLDAIGKGISSSNDGLEDLDRASSRSSDGLEELASSTKNSNKAFGDFSRDFKWHSKLLIDGFKNADPQQILESSIEVIQDGLKGIAALSPALAVPAGAAGLALEGLSLVGGAAIGALEGFSQRTKELAQSGVILGEGVATFSNQVLDSGITLGQYTKFVTENADSLRLIGGSAKEGSKQILGLRKQVIGTEEQFNRLGFATEEIPNILSDFAESITYTGGTLDNMSSQEVQQRTADYAKNLRIIADITGKDAKSRKEASRAAAAEALNQSYLLKLQNSGVEGAFTAFGNISAIVGDTLGPQAAKLWSQYNTDIGVALDGQTALWEQANPEVAAVLRDYKEKLAANQITAEQAEKGILAALTSIPDEALKAAALRTAELGSASAMGAKGLEAFEEVNKQIIGTGQLIKLNLKELENNMTAAKTTRDQITQGIVNLEATKQQLEILQSKTAISIATLAGPMMSEALEKLVGSVNYAADMIRIQTLPEREQQISSTLSKLENAPESVTGEELDDMIMAMQREYRYRIEQEGGVEGWALWLTKPIQLLADNIEDAIGAGRDNYTNQQLIELTKQQLDFVKDQKSDKLLPSDKERYLQENPDISSRARPVEPRSVQSESPVESEYQFNSNQYMPHARGGIIDKPRKVLVGEAGPELILPAERGSNGKLGLEVSGAMLDNSRLLQSLVKVNEDQAAMIAGLNSQMANMNNNFEKLVYEQRQANRLAV